MKRQKEVKIKRIIPSLFVLFGSLFFTNLSLFKTVYSTGENLYSPR